MEERFYRAAINGIPRDQSRLRDSAIPLFFSVEFENEEMEVPLVSEPLVRCNKCKGYLNPYAEVLMPGMKWRCNLCENVNEVQTAFLMHERAGELPGGDALSNAAFNRKHFQRKDLCCDVYEIQAGDNFAVKTSDPPVLCFVIEVSLEARNLSMPVAVLECVREALRNADYDKRTRVCFMFFHESVFLLGSDGNMIVVSGEVPLVLPDSILIPLDDLVSGAFTVDIDRISAYFATTAVVGSDILLPLAVAKGALRHASLFLFFSSMPSAGKSKLFPSPSLACSNSDYRSLAESLFRKNVGVNLFVMARANIELPTISIFSQLTGGQTFVYPNFTGANPTATSKLFCDLQSHFSRNVGYAAACRIRANDGVVLKETYGNFMQKSADLLGFANWTPSHAINFTLVPFNDVRNALYVQIAMIRTTKKGERLVRVFNICLPIQDGSMYDSCNAYAIAHCLILESFYYEGRKRLGGGEHINKRISAIWKEVKNNQAVTPAALESLSTLVLACRKSVPLRPDSATPMDFKIFYVYLFSNLYNRLVETLIYPVLLNITDSCPVPLPLSSSVLDPTGLFILDAGANLFFFIGKNCPEEIFSQLFPAPISGPFMFEPPENELSAYVRELIVYLIGHRPVKPNFILANDVENSIYSKIFYTSLHNDMSGGLPSAEGYKQEIESNIK